MTKKQMTDELHKRLDGSFREFKSAEKRYFEQPSITNGSRKQDARDQFDEALGGAEEYALEKWGLTTQEFNKLLDEMGLQ